MHTSWESAWRLVGSKGSALWDGGEQFNAQAVTATGSFISTFEDAPLPDMDTTGYESGHDSLIRDFVRCMRVGEAPGTICSDNIKSLAMVFGAIEAAETGGRVTITI
jgi:predicted dehydrogenase